VGIVLDVTPQVGQDGFITLNVHPTISDIVGIAESPNEDTQPILAVRELDTVGRVRDGETLIIAGLVAEGSVNERSGVPILKDLPLLGYLFGSTSVRKTSTELVILLTPMVMEGVKIDEMADEAENAIMDRM
jgi:type II secretory pathway component GspD/PulD (secretin)